jgi:predicted phosphodiesterase
MVLEFPILADYVLLFLDGLTVFATHGHHHNTATPPPLRKGEILLHGHTHIPVCVPFGNENHYINPGSISLPKGGLKQSYMIYEGRRFTVKSIDGDIIWEKEF